jgi:hypothetical protein
MQLDESDHQLLGVIEFNGPELYDVVGKQYGKSLTCIELKHLTGFDNRDSVNLSRRLSQSGSPNESRSHREH